MVEVSPVASVSVVALAIVSADCVMPTARRAEMMEEALMDGIAKLEYHGSKRCRQCNGRRWEDFRARRYLAARKTGKPGRG